MVAADTDSCRPRDIAYKTLLLGRSRIFIRQIRDEHLAVVLRVRNHVQAVIAQSAYMNGRETETAAEALHGVFRRDPIPVKERKPILIARIDLASILLHDRAASKESLRHDLIKVLINPLLL
jgi:hypothetical protein